MSYDDLDDECTMRGGGPTATHENSGSLGRIDQYELTQELGGGGFGTVFLARDTISCTAVAVKGLPPIVKNSKEELENIRSNFAMVGKLTHTNIAKMLVLHPSKSVEYACEDVRQKLRVAPGDFLMVMEYAPGVTLSKWRQQFPDGRVPIPRAINIVRQVASALDYAHTRRIIHRDIKPANVMVETSEDGVETVRVLDFGLAAEIRSSVSRMSQEVRDKSGTRPYMAPEQWLGKRQGPATDQYALAAMFHELVAGEVPFASVFGTGDPVVMMNAVGRERFTASDDLPRHIRRALEKALSKNPEGRYKTCGDFVAELEGRDRRMLLPVSIAALSLIVVAVVLLCVFGGGERKSGGEAERTVAQPQPELPSQSVVQPQVVTIPQALAVSTQLVAQLQSVLPPRPATPLQPVAPQPVVPQPVVPQHVAPQHVEQHPATVPEPAPVPEAISASELAELDSSVLIAGTVKTVCTRKGNRFNLVWCPPGSFSMGCPAGEAGRGKDEDPAHEVEIKNGFWIGQHEVSYSLWLSLMENFRKGDYNDAVQDQSMSPVWDISRNDCIEFTRRLNADNGTRGFRLPTEAEWEYACRAGTTTAYNFGDNATSTDMTVHSRSPSAFGLYRPNNWGIFDMHGNIAEWCDSEYPRGSGDYILKGGSWKSDSVEECRSAARVIYGARRRPPLAGMRLCFQE